MKKLLIAASFLTLTSQAFAAVSTVERYSPRAIYNALNAVENITEGQVPGSITPFKKEVGGLSCHKIFYETKKSESSYYRCSLEDKSLDAEAIYNAFNVEAVNVSGRRMGVHALQKSKGGLTCTRTSPVVLHPVPHYTCVLADSLSE